MAGLGSQLALGFPDSRLLKLELHGTYMGSRGLDYSLHAYNGFNH